MKEVLPWLFRSCYLVVKVIVVIVVGIKVTNYNTIINASSATTTDTSHTFILAFTTTSPFVRASTFNCSCSS